MPVARIVALLLILLPIGVYFVVSNIARAGPSQEAKDIANFNPRAVFSDNTPHFLPTPIAALPPEVNSGPPAAAAAPTERVKVANTGGAGAILRTDPPKGRQVASLRDGTVLTVLEHQDIGGSDWLHVKTPDGAQGWVFSKLVGPE